MENGHNHNNNQICFAGSFPSAHFLNVGGVSTLLPLHILPSDIRFCRLSYHFSAHGIQTAILVVGLSLELQPFMFDCLMHIFTRCLKTVILRSS